MAYIIEKVTVQKFSSREAVRKLTINKKLSYKNMCNCHGNTEKHGISQCFSVFPRQVLIPRSLRCFPFQIGLFSKNLFF